MSQQALHGLAGRLCRDFEDDALSYEQEWLLGCALSELEYRRRRALRTHHVLQACHCWLCLPLDEWSVEAL
jgi:hypothetical protein